MWGKGEGLGLQDGYKLHSPLNTQGKAARKQMQPKSMRVYSCFRNLPLRNWTGAWYFQDLALLTQSHLSKK